MTMIGIDIGGTNIKAVRLDAAGQVLQSAHYPTPTQRDALIERVRALLTELGANADASVGIAAPGLADADNRAIQWMRGRLDCIEGLNWSTHLNRPACVLNDAHAATLGEAWIGAAKNKQHVIMLTLGTGVGGGVIVHGKLLQGAIGRAGHLGHISLDPDGAPDIVGTPGSLEDCIGAHALHEQSDGRFEQTVDLLAAAEGGDVEANRLWGTRVKALACAVVSLINAFDPEVVVLGGGMAQAGDALFEPLAQWMAQLEWQPLGEGVPIVAAALGETAGAIGAARFASMKHETSEKR
ncbi:MAG: ROK family protein [Phycisphaeraceae bacterium]